MSKAGGSIRNSVRGSVWGSNQGSVGVSSGGPSGCPFKDLSEVWPDWKSGPNEPQDFYYYIKDLSGVWSLESGQHVISEKRQEYTYEHSVKYWYGEFPIPGTLFTFGGIGKNWCTKKYRNRYLKKLVPEKVSELVSEKFGTVTDFRSQNLGI